jgi:hypothetical protein
MFSGKKNIGEFKAPPPFDEKPLKFSGIWENFVQPPPLQCTYILFRFSECLDYYKSQAAKPDTEKEIFFSFPVADPDILKI